MLARRTAHILVLVTVRPVWLWQLTAIVEIWFGRITKWPPAGTTRQVDRRDRFFLERFSNPLFEIGRDLLRWRPDKIRMVSGRVVRRVSLLVHLVPIL